jgi:hypothetical protein
MANALWDFLVCEVYIRDWYYDVYNQKPHLDKDLYLWVLGYHQFVDKLMWCGLSFRTMDDIVGDYANHATQTRTRMEEYAREHFCNSDENQDYA